VAEQCRRGIAPPFHHAGARERACSYTSTPSATSHADCAAESSCVLAEAVLADEWLKAERPMPASELAHVLVRQTHAIVAASRAG